MFPYWRNTLRPKALPDNFSIANFIKFTIRTTTLGGADVPRLLNFRELNSLFLSWSKSPMNAARFCDLEAVPNRIEKRQTLFSFLKRGLQHTHVKKLDISINDLTAEEIWKLRYNGRQNY